MVSIAQLVRASDCGSEGRGFDPHVTPKKGGHPEWMAAFSLSFFLCLVLQEVVDVGRAFL